MLVVLVAIALIWAFTFVRGLIVGSAEVEAELATNQADAAIESGQDAVETVGQNNEQAENTEDKVEGIQNDVNQAPDSDSADRAGRNGLCVQFGIGCEE